MERVQWIKSHQKELGELGQKVDNVKDAERLFNGNTDAIVEAFKARAKSAALAAKATALYTKQLELEENYVNTYYRKAVKAGQKADWHPTTPNEATWGYGSSARHGVSRSGLYESGDGGVTWVYTAKGAAEANKKLTQTDETLKNIQSDYDDINAQINETVGQMAKLAQTAKSVQKSTPTTVRHTAHTKNSATPSFAAGSLADLENQLSELQNKYKNGFLTLNKDDYLAKVSELKTAIERKKIELGLYVPEDKVSEQLKKLSEKNAAISRSQSYSSYDVAVGNNLPQGARDLNYIQQQMNFNDSLLQQLQELANAYKALGDAGKEGLESINAEIEKVTANQTELGNSARNYTSENKRIQESAENWGKVGSMVGDVGSAFSSLGSSFKSPELNAAGIVANAIATLI